MSNVMLRRAGVPVLAAIAASSLAGGAAAEPETIRIACGAAAAFTDAAGRAWREDAGFFDGVAVTDVGAPADIATECRSERYGMSGFWVPAANGRHRVTLTFCEAYDGIEGPGGASSMCKSKACRFAASTPSPWAGDASSPPRGASS